MVRNGNYCNDEICAAHIVSVYIVTRAVDSYIWEVLLFTTCTHRRQVEICILCGSGRNCELRTKYETMADCLERNLQSEVDLSMLHVSVATASVNI